MGKGLTVRKWELTVWLKIPQMPQNLSAQFVCPSPKNPDFNGKRLHWASIARGINKLGHRISFLKLLGLKLVNLKICFRTSNIGFE